MGRKLHGPRQRDKKSNATIVFNSDAKDIIFQHRPKECPVADADMATIPSTETYGSPIEKWAVGITVAPRKVANYTYTIDSFLAAGWDSIHLFFEPNVKLADHHKHLPLTQRKKKLGAWKNWLTSLNDLIEIYPDADCYGLIQDDVIFCKGTKDFLTHTLWPEKDAGVCSVFTPQHYTREKPGWYKTNKKGCLWMAQTYFFPPDSARDCAKHPICTGWKKDRQIDNIVGRWANNVGQYPYYFSPSLAQHIGDTSTLWNEGNKAAGRRAARDFVGEYFNAYEFAKHNYDYEYGYED